MEKIVTIFCCLFLLAGCVNKQPETFDEDTKDDEVVADVVVNGDVDNESHQDETPLVVIKEIDLMKNERSSFESVWKLSSDGIGYSREITKGNHEISISSWEDGSSPLNMSCYGISLMEGNQYAIEMTISSDICNQLIIDISDYHGVLYSKNFSLSSTPTTIQWSFTMNHESIWDGKIDLKFYAVQKTGVISVEDLLVDSVMPVSSVKVNQIGYYPDSEKTAVFTYNSGDTFDIVDVLSNEVVYTGIVFGAVENEDANEKNYIGDFSDFKTPGRYKIVSQILAESYEFVIEENAYQTLLNDALFALSTQRCGHVLNQEIFGELSHEACHTEEALTVSGKQNLDVTGGWHDAGDYGRYVTPGVKAVSDLLISALLYDDVLTDQMGIMESGNGISDVLDEARVELEWLMKMQRETGSFYNSVISKNFAPLVAPEQDNQQLYIMKQENSATAAASAALALASYVYRSIDQNFANRCLQSAKRGYLYAKQYMGSQDIFNPEGYNGGDYPNVSDVDETFYAAMSMYLATNDLSYLEDAQMISNSLSGNYTDFTYDSFAGYGAAIYLLYGDENTQFYQNVREVFLNKVQELMDRSHNDGYFMASTYGYSWGASMYICSDAMLLLCGYELTKDEDILETVQNQLDYLIGKNALNMSFVTGYGSDYPKNAHNRLTIGKNAYLTGSLVSGVDRNRGSEILSVSISKEIPAAKRYLDHSESYTNNEVAIYFNSGLIFLVSALESIY